MITTLQPASLRRALSLAGALVLLAGTGMASAQESKDDQPLKGSFDQPLQGAHAGHQEGVSSTMMMSESDGSDTYTIKIVGDDVSAEINGKPVPKDRIRRKDGKVEILDKDGDVLKSFDVQVMGGMGGQQQFKIQSMPGGTMRVRPMVPGGNGAGGLTIAGQMPPVMMGITMSDSDDGVVVDSVLDGLPADKSGIKVGDHLLSVDGKKLEDQQALRDLLKTKSPGDTIQLKVEREGKEKNISVKLAKFEMDKLQVQGMGNAEPLAITIPGDHGGALDEAMKSLQKALDELKANENLKPEKIRAKAEQALQEAIDSLDKARDQMTLKLDQWKNDWDQNGGMKRFFGNDGKTFVWPGNQGGPDSDTSKQLDKLSEQIERLNKRLDQLEKDKK